MYCVFFIFKMMSFRFVVFLRIDSIDGYAVEETLNPSYTSGFLVEVGWGWRVGGVRERRRINFQALSKNREFSF